MGACYQLQQVDHNGGSAQILQFFWYFYTFIPLSLVGRELVIANSVRGLSTVSYPTRIRKIIARWTIN